MKALVLIALFAIFSYSTFAQSYRTAVGVRVGTEVGITMQQKLWEKVTLEGIAQAGLRDDDLLVTALMERHYPLLTKRFNFYLGAGVHKGWYRKDSLLEDPFGATLIAGAEMSIGRLNISYDFKPVFNIVGGERFFDSQTALSVRYIIIKKKKKKINLKFWEKW